MPPQRDKARRVAAVAAAAADRLRLDRGGQEPVGRDVTGVRDRDRSAGAAAAALAAERDEAGRGRAVAAAGADRLGENARREAVLRRERPSVVGLRRAGVAARATLGSDVDQSAAAAAVAAAAANRLRLEGGGEKALGQNRAAVRRLGAPAGTAVRRAAADRHEAARGGAVAAAAADRLGEHAGPELAQRRDLAGVVVGLRVAAAAAAAAGCADRDEAAAPAAVAAAGPDRLRLDAECERPLRVDGAAVVGDRHGSAVAAGAAAAADRDETAGPAAVAAAAADRLPDDADRKLPGGGDVAGTRDTDGSAVAASRAVASERDDSGRAAGVAAAAADRLADNAERA